MQLYPQQAAASDLEYVGIGRRAYAILIDDIIITIILMIVTWIIDMVFPSSEVMIAHSGFASMVIHISPATVFRLIIFFCYFIVMEAIWGATVGKLALGIRVVKLDGSPIRWSESILRNLWRSIDYLPGFSPLLGGLLIWTSPTRQRLGDRVAHTVVVRRR